MPAGRLIVAGSAVVDVVVFVPQLPAHGGDVIATGSLRSAAGAFNVLAAAARFGAEAALLGRHGTGPNGDIVRAACAAEGIALCLPPSLDGDTGFCIGLVDGTGERTYVTVPGVDGALPPEDAEACRVEPGDFVYMSGYELAFDHGFHLSEWFSSLPSSVTTVFDPGPLITTLPTQLLDRVLSRMDWISLNRREATEMADAEPALAAELLLHRYPNLDGVIVRDGGEGCWVATPGTAPDHVRSPGGAVAPVDTTGAGDCHVGTFFASLLMGAPTLEAARLANHAARISVQRYGPAAGPTRSELDSIQRA